MKLLVCASLLLSLTALADSRKVIYGDDNRLDVFESKDSAMVEYSQSTAAQITPENIKVVGAEAIISASTLVSEGICASERFAKQISAARCSGFLVSDKLLVTAGHCITDESDCNSYKWVFDYKVDHADQKDISVPATSVYSCSKIISRSLDQNNNNDYALVELDRAVTDRAPLEVRTSGKIEVGDPVVVIGHPTGLPTKIADGANVRALKGVFFVANLDTYGGNSGSAVLNAKSGKVEGILVRGENDYRYDSVNGCKVSQKCSSTGCRGEDVTYISNIAELVHSAR